MQSLAKTVEVTDKQQTMRRFCLVLMMFCAAPWPARADERVLRFDVPELPLWATTPPGGGEPVGIAPTAIHMVLDKARLRGEIRALPMRRLLAPESASGRDYLLFVDEGDGAPPGSVRLARLLELNAVVVARRGIPLHERADLDRVGPIAIARGVAVPGSLRGDEALQFDEVRSLDSGLRMLAAGHVNAVLGIDAAIDRLAEQLGDTDILGDSLAVQRLDGMLGASDAEAATPEASAIGRAASDLAKSGAFAAVTAQMLQAAPAE
jgi:hypothetical protein